MDEKTTIATTSAHHVDASAPRRDSQADDRAVRVREAFAADASDDDNPLAAMLGIEAARILAVAGKFAACLLASIAHGVSAEVAVRMADTYAKLCRQAANLLTIRQEILRRPT